MTDIQIRDLDPITKIAFAAHIQGGYSRVVHPYSRCGESPRSFLLFPSFSHLKFNPTLFIPRFDIPNSSLVPLLSPLYLPAYPAYTPRITRTLLAGSSCPRSVESRCRVWWAGTLVGRESTRT